MKTLFIWGLIHEMGNVASSDSEDEVRVDNKEVCQFHVCL
jgi:hypothetical protein